MDQPGKIANPARGQLNRETGSTISSRVNVLIIHTQAESGASLLTGFLPILAAAYIYLYRHTQSSQSRVYRVTQMRTDGVHCGESAGTGPVVFKVVPVTGAAFAGHHGLFSVRLSFFYTR